MDVASRPVNPRDSASFVALREAVDADPSAASAGAHLDAIADLLGEVLPIVEAQLLSATRGPNAPAPLDEAARHLVASGGKRVRPVTALLVTSACGGDPRLATPMAAAAELVHSATLLHDDVIDEGAERRGRPSTRVLWGNLVSVLSGDMLLTQALELVESAGVPGVMGDLLATLHALIAGEVAQLKARGREDVGLEGYLEVVRGKTASLFAFACRAGARAARADASVIDAVGRFGAEVGVAFQVVDDVLDLSGDPRAVGKRLGADLAEGKTTLPLALALARDPVPLRDLLPRARTGDVIAAEQIATSPLMQTACTDAREFARGATARGLAELAMLPASRAKALLEGVVRDLTTRRA